MAAKKYRDRYYQRAIEAGLCRVCCKAQPVEGMKRCQPCREYQNAASAKYRARYPERAKAQQIACEARRPGRYADNRRRYTARIRDAIFKKYGDKCVHCGFNDRRALQVDHIDGGGTYERNVVFKNGCNSYWRHVLDDTTGKYQLLCANCNSIKRHVNREFPKNGRAPQ